METYTISTPRKLPITLLLTFDYGMFLKKYGIKKEKEAEYLHQTDNFLNSKISSEFCFETEMNVLDFINDYKPEITNFFLNGTQVEITCKLIINNVTNTARKFFESTSPSDVYNVTKTVRNIVNAILAQDVAVPFLAETFYASRGATDPSFLGTCTVEKLDWNDAGYACSLDINMKPVNPGHYWNQMKECTNTDVDKLTKYLRRMAIPDQKIPPNPLGNGWEKFPSAESWVRFIRVYYYAPELFSLGWDNESRCLTIKSEKHFREEREIIHDTTSRPPNGEILEGDNIRAFLPYALHILDPDFEFKYPRVENYQNSESTHAYKMVTSTRGTSIVLSFRKLSLNPVEIANEAAELEQKLEDIKYYFKSLRKAASELFESGKSIIEAQKEELAAKVKNDPLKYENAEKYSKPITELAKYYLNNTDGDIDGLQDSE